MPLRLRRADRAPGTASAEYFGKGPESLVYDLDCSLGAKAVYVAITLAIAEDRGHSVCPTLYTRTMEDLAHDLGLSTRQARRLVAELEARGHVERERVRTIAGSPQAIRTTAKLRGAATPCTRSDPSDCNRTNATGAPVILGRAPGQIRPGDRTSLAGTLKREKPEEEEQQQADGSAGVVAPFSAPPSNGGEEAPDRPTRPRFVEAIVMDLADALNYNVPPKSPRMKNPGLVTAKSQPGAQRRARSPDASKSTKPDGQPSRPENAIEHKARYRTITGAPMRADPPSRRVGTAHRPRPKRPGCYPLGFVSARKANVYRHPIHSMGYVDSSHSSAPAGSRPADRAASISDSSSARLKTW